MNLKSALLILLLMVSGQAMAQNTGFDWYSKGSKVHFFAKDTTYYTYEWDFGEPLATGAGMTIIHTYAGYNKQYTVVLTVTDSNANKSTFQNTVGTGIYENSTIPDTIAPVLTLVGASEVNVLYNTIYNDPGVTIFDDRDSITAWDTSGGFYQYFPDGNANLLGIYTIVYKVKDKAGNEDSVTRLVNVVDTIPPVITMNGDSFMKMQVGTKFIDPGVTVSDNYGTPILEAMGTFPSILSTDGKATKLGQFTLIYTATDVSNNVGTATRIIEVSDTIPPYIQLVGPQVFCYFEGDTIDRVDPGFTTGDDYWSNNEIIVDPLFCADTFYIKKPGTYKVFGYTATDFSGNRSDTVWRYFIIKRLGDTSACVLKNTLKDSCQILDIPTAFTSSSFLNDIKIYPNPASNQVIIALGELTGESVNIRLLDISGRDILQQRHSSGMQGGRIELNTSSVPNGLYLIEVSTDTGVLAERISIAR